MKLSLTLLIALPLVATADDFDNWKVPDGVTTSPNKCAKGDATECLHIAWASEAGSRGINETNHQRLEHARDYFMKACDIAKKKTCANADRISARLAKVDALKSDTERNQFWCGEAMDSAKLWAADSSTAPTIVERDCLEQFGDTFLDAMSGIGKKAADQRPAQLLGALIDNVCPTMKSKPAECSTAPAKLSVAKQRDAAAKILGATIAGDKRGAELVGWVLK